MVEILHASGTSLRWHVTHIAVEGKEQRGGELRVRVGVDQGGSIVGGARFDVRPGQRDRVMALFAEARRRRERFRGD